VDVLPPPPESGEGGSLEGQDAPASPAAQVPAPTGAPAGDRPKRRRPLVIAVAAIVILGLIGGAIALSGKGGTTDTASASPSVSPSPSPTPTAPGQPQKLHTKKVTAFEVDLVWTPGEGTDPATSYDVLRNGKLIYVVMYGHTYYTDTQVFPAKTYHYRVVALDTDEHRSEAADLTVTTKDAAPALAPLTGVYDIKLHATSHYGYSSFGMNDFTAGWRLDPQCGEGACDTRLKDLHVAAFTTTLTKGPTGYSATLSAKGFARCGSTETTASVTIAVHAVDAVYTHGVWRVTRLEGTMIVRTSSQLGCVSSGIDYQFTGRFVK